jgi:hypothetical protein
MKFLIQKCNGEIKHDFAFTLLESIRFRNWLTNRKDVMVRFVDTDLETDAISRLRPSPLKAIHRNYVPIGSVEFVTFFLEKFYGLTPKPINVPQELYSYAGRDIWNGNHLFLDNTGGKFFVKSADRIKGFSEVVECRTDNFTTTFSPNIPIGNYQYSNYVSGIVSEWRAFVYEGKLVGLQNYSGEFTKFPTVGKINEMIKKYKSAPIAYTLDVGIINYGYHQQTIVIEVHDFFSCGLYGFADHAILPNMFYKWFWQYIQREMVEQKREKI